jgi:hypothetical protein
MYGKNFRKVAYIDCKIIEYEMNRRTFFIVCKIRPANYTTSLLKTFALYKVEAFDFVLTN